MAYASKAFDHLGIIFASRAERGWTPSCGMPGAGHLVPAGRIRTAALNPRSLISRGGARQDGAWEPA